MNYILTVDSQDRPGIVAAVSSCLADLRYNIEDAAQYCDKFSGRFSMRVVFRSTDKEEPGTERLEKEFKVIAVRFGLSWNISSVGEKVPALIMVSRADHCLDDILYRTRTGHLPLDIRGVVSNHQDCRDIAKQNKIPFIHLPMREGNKAAKEKALRTLIEETGTELVVLARYMQILSDQFCTDYAGRLINIHHSFLPGFKGARPYHQAWERGVKIIGATAHFVTADLDEGPIIEQATTRINHAVTADEMKVLGQDIEAQVLSRALLYYAERRIFLHGNRTVVL